MEGKGNTNALLPFRPTIAPSVDSESCLNNDIRFTFIGPMNDTTMPMRSSAVYVHPACDVTRQPRQPRGHFVWEPTALTCWQLLHTPEVQQRLWQKAVNRNIRQAAESPSMKRKRVSALKKKVKLRATKYKETKSK
ncbi:hypothetical protein H257_07509 [Aphanomyces astaci]|uniref:Uncharacterized protein n=1 Tax=Aphanomyces astaci TaxID=112090 RepID=W4GKF9_APHAT|nr:hypothetical protein H257_07509 [Aphanomyces astaci]ETV79519.1 hypothetical protein H257_07509 [Aphanomyces astaci]|eukprot:XP_009831360.1 hypothetical protein H257_07509 [Aphanomyces astaci]